MLKIIGCGGHCKVVIDALKAGNFSEDILLCDSDIEKLGQDLLGIKITHTSADLILDFGPIHIAIGDNQIRKKNFGLLSRDTVLYTIIHPDAVVSTFATVSSGSFIAAKAIIGPNAFVDTCCIINHGAVIDHDVKIGAFSHVAPNSTLGGNVQVEEGVFIGANATILPGITIGNGAIVGAGAVVTKNVLEFDIVIGVPAVSILKNDRN